MSGLRLREGDAEDLYAGVSCTLYSCNVIHDGDFILNYFFFSLSRSGFLFGIGFDSLNLPHDPE